MKNLKKLLAVVLVAAMAFSLAAVASAENPATKFSDGADVKNVAAVDLLTGIGIIEGNEGAFNPTGTLTREQAAKIVAYLLNGTGAANLKAASAPFSDVAKDRWSAGYIAFCVEEGIVAGTGDGTFNPEGKLTGVAWAKMLLCALGYDATAEGFVGENWAVNIVKVVNKVGLTLGLNIDLAAEISRDDACALAYKALEATMVEYPSTGTTITIGDTTVQTGAGKAQAMRNDSGSGYKSGGAAANDVYMQLCEMYFPHLQKASTTNSGRSGYVWKNVHTNALISGFYSTDKVIATSYLGLANVTALTTPTNAFFKALPDTEIKYWSNGTQINTGTAAGDLAAANALVKNGVVVELMDAAPYDGDVDNVLITVKKIAKLSVNPVTTITSGAVTYVTVAGCTGLSNIDKTLVHGYEGLAKDDIVKYYSLYDAATAKTHWYIEKCTSVTGTVTAYSAAAGSVTIGGTPYFGSGLDGGNFTPGTSLFGVPDVTFYLDDGGYICFTTTAAPAFNPANYLFLKDAANESTVAANYQGLAVFLDGTKSVIRIAAVAGDATSTLLTPNAVDDSPDGTCAARSIEEYSFYSFTKNTDGSYNLRYAANQDYDYENAIATTRKPGFATGITTVANANTVFVYENTDLDMFFAYTGVTAAPLYTVAADDPEDPVASSGVYVLEDITGTFALAVVGVGGTADSTISGAFEQVYVTGSATTVYSTPSNYYTYSAVVNGVPTEIESTLSDLVAGELYLVNQYTGGRISGVHKYIDTTTDVAWHNLADRDAAVTDFTWNASVLTVDTESYITDANAKVFVYDTRVIPATVTEYTPDQINGLDALVDGNDTVNVIKVSSTNPNIGYVYVKLVA